MKRRAVAALLLVAAPAAALAADDPAGYVWRAPLALGQGGSLQRLAVPAGALAASRVDGLADLRVFDATGQAMPMALSHRGPEAERGAVRLAALPILGPMGTLAAGGVSLRIDGGRESVVRVEGVPTATRATLLGVLLDTRAVAAPADRLTLNLTLPRGRPLAFTVAISDDLADWRPLVTRTLYRANGGADEEAIAFPATSLRGCYLRVTWEAQELAEGQVAVHAAALSTLSPPDLARLPRAVVRPATSNTHAIDLTLPTTAPLAALEIAATGGEAVVPVRILGRDNPEQAWTQIAAGTVFRVTENGRERRNPPFDLAGATFRSLRIEADARSAGFASAPAIAVRFAPATLLFLAGGRPPFTLASGNAGAADAALSVDSLVPGHSPAREASLPRATTPAAADPVLATVAEDRDRRGLLLWGVLLAGTALLAAMVWRLLRQRPSAEPSVSPPA